MDWLRRLFQETPPPPPAPDIRPTLARMQESREHVVAHTERRRRDAAQTRLEQTQLRRTLRTNPLADDLYGGPPR